MDRIRRFITKSVLQRQDLTFITEIPSKILDIIFDLLSTPDQICLSLSCKHLYAYYFFFLKARGTSLRELLPREIRPILCRNAEIESRPRIHLLRQLRNERWEYCYECWNLHPRSAWYRCFLRLFISPYIFSETYPGNLQLYGRYGCMLVAGQMDICPCLTITFRNKLHLMEDFRRSLKDPDGFKAYYSKILTLRHLDKRPFVTHVCHFDKHRLAKVRILTLLHINKGGLYLHAWYEFEPKILPEKTPQALCRAVKTTSICPFKSPKKWIRQFFIEAGSSFSGFPFTASFETRRDNKPIHMYSFSIFVRRRLGVNKWPDRGWRAFSHH